MSRIDEILAEQATCFHCGSEKVYSTHRKGWACRKHTPGTLKPKRNEYLEKSTLDLELEELHGIGSREFFATARLETDPWTFVDDTVKYLKSDGEHDAPWDYRHGAEDVEAYEEFFEACEEFKNKLDAALTSEDKTLTRDEQDEPEPKFDTRYSLRDFRQDAWGHGNVNMRPEFVVDSQIGGSSRKTWKRVTKGDPIRHLSDWGTFSLDLTKKYADSKVRVRTHIRKGIPFLAVGAVQINMQTGHLECYVSGCGWKRALRYYEANAATEHFLKNGMLKPEDLEFDKEYAEFQILSILAHLGEHTRTNHNNYWTPINDVKRHRDSDEDKLRSAWAAAGA